MSNKSFNEQAKGFLGIVVAAIVLIFIVVKIIYWVVTEYVIPFLIGLFLFGLALLLGIILVRLFAKLVAYLTLRRRRRQQIASLSEEISQLEKHVLVTNKRGIADGARLRSLGITGREKYAEQQNAATALADHLQNELDGLNKARARIERKIERRASDKLSRKLEKVNRRTVPLETEIEQLKNNHDIEPDPAFKRKERMYPMISGFDSFISSRFKRNWDQ
jgi:hypothetical protein